MKHTKLVLCLASTGFLGGLAWQAHAQTAPSSCPVTNTAPTFSGSSLTTTCATPTSTSCTVKTGTSASGGVIQLSNAGANFTGAQVGISSTITYAATGDFNHDGWQDFVGAPQTGGSSSKLELFENQTWQSENCTTPACTAYSAAAPNWAVSTPITPKFVSAINLHSLQPYGLSGYGSNGASSGAFNFSGDYVLAGGDFNGDGWDDVFEIFGSGTHNCNGGASCGLTRPSLYLNKAANATGSNATGTLCVNSPVSTNGTTATPIANTCAQFNNPYNPIPGLSQFTTHGIGLGDVGSNIQVVDYDGDGHLDVLIGTDELGGSIHILRSTCTEVVPTVFNNGLKKCASNPTFLDGAGTTQLAAGYLVSWLNYGNVYAKTGGTDSFASANAFDGSSTNADNEPIFYYGDLDGDGMKDLLVGNVNCCLSYTRNIRLFKGCAASNVPSPGTCGPNKLETTASQYLPGTTATNPPSAVDIILIADFSLDGKVDALIGTDTGPGPAGGNSYLWKNTGTSTPFSALATQITTRGTGAGQAQDYDVGFLFDYDHDPNHTPDALMADGNGTGNYYILSNRVAATFVNCGEVQGTVDVGSVATSDAVITTARISPSFSAPTGTSIQFWASNATDETSWVGPLSTCASAPLTDYCATFTKPVGQTVRWKAKLCTTNIAVTPTLSGIGVKYDYTNAAEHYRSGVVVNDGVAYVGAFRQPGDRGRFYAVNAGLTGTPLWEASSKLDGGVGGLSDGQRNIYTAVNGSQLAFTVANATTSTPFQTLLGGNATTAPALVTYVRGARFGLGSSSSPLSKLGSVVSSTPATLTKPGRPNWYTFATTTERGYADSFVTAKANRVPLALFGSKDAMVHAIYSIPSNLTDSRNGQEAWAYIPPTVAASLMTDQTAQGVANTAAADGLNHPISTLHYPDGSPTLLDYYNGATVKTVALVAEGNGGRSFSAFDVTQTVDPTSGAVTGPLPMWNATPGTAAAGYAYTKPTVARVSIGSTERFVVVAGTGLDPNDPTPSPAAGAKGRIVAGFDLATGATLWQFQTKCPVTSEITAFETDDTGEAATPTIDGYIDRVVFADNCGYVYKLNPGVDLSGGWLANTSMGTINTGTNPGGGISWALFDTSAATALGSARPIAGTIAARIDSSTRMILYFGTGGTESTAANLVNHFYAVYADTGVIRSKYVGTCTAGLCEKFYGGAVVTPTQIIFTRTVDPSVATSTCDEGKATIQAYEINANGSGAFVSDFTQNVSSAVMGAMFGDAGAIYFATLNGDVTRIGTPRAASAGGDTSTGQTQGTGTGQNGAGVANSSGAFTLLGWRTVL